MLGETLKQLRKSNNLSIRALAEKAEISKSTISDIENDKINPTSDTLQKISAALKVEIGDLFTTEEKLELANDTIDKIGIIAEKALKYPSYVNETNKSIETILENFEFETFTEEESTEIINFINYTISKRRK